MARKESSPEASSLAALYLGLSDDEMVEALRLHTAPADVRRLAASVLSQDETPQTPDIASVDHDELAQVFSQANVESGGDADTPSEGT